MKNKRNMKINYGIVYLDFLEDDETWYLQT